MPHIEKDFKIYICPREVISRRLCGRLGKSAFVAICILKITHVCPLHFRRLWTVFSYLLGCLHFKDNGKIYIFKGQGKNVHFHLVWDIFVFHQKPGVITI